MTPGRQIPTPQLAELPGKALVPARVTRPEQTIELAAAPPRDQADPHVEGRGDLSQRGDR